MSRLDRILYLGSTWFIDGVALDRFGKPLDMTGGDVEFRLVGPSGLLVTLTTPGDVSVATGTTGAYTGTLAATDSRQAALAPGLFDYEIDAITASGVVSVQTTGKIMLSDSLRQHYPGTSPSGGSHLILAGGGNLLLADGSSKLLLAS